MIVRQQQPQVSIANLSQPAAIGRPVKGPGEFILRFSSQRIGHRLLPVNLMQVEGALRPVGVESVQNEPATVRRQLQRRIMGRAAGQS